MQTTTNIHRLFVIVILAITPQYLFAQTINPTVDIDACILNNTRPGYEANNSTNYGTGATIFAQAGTNGGYKHYWRSLIGLNLSALPPGVTINSATLTLYGSGGHYNYYLNGSGYQSNACWLRRTTQAWTESGVTWNNQPTVTSANQASLISSTNISQDYIVDITQLVKDMISNPGQGDGLLMLLQNEVNYCTMSFCSSDNTNTGKRPVVSVTYTINAVSYTLNLSTTTNYIRTITPEVKMSTVPGVSATHDASKINEDIQYVDGLGRPLQTLAIAASPIGKDVIQPIAYDSYGRETNKYLPYSVASNNGALVNPTSAISGQQTFYNSLYAGEGTNAKSHIVYEPSPLNRVLESGAPGAAWQPTDETGNSAGHTQKLVYTTNAASDVLMMTVDASNNLVFASSGGTSNGGKYYYNANTLYKTIVKDESWKKNTDVNVHSTVEFKDKESRVILKRSYLSESEKIETYYIYDDFGLLRYVISPKAVPDLALPLSSTSNLVKTLCYYYQYDNRNRMAIKQIPGADPVYMVYDNRDRLVLTQDGERRKNKQWLFTKYDYLNRAVVTGILTYPSDKTQKQMQTIINSSYPTRSYFITRNNTGETGYADGSFPMVNDGSLEYLTATWYDTYGFPGAHTFDDNNNVSGYSDSDGDVRYFDKLQNKVTGTSVKVLEGSTWLTTTNYYDNKYRLIQSRRDLYNGSNTGGETVSNFYDFTGKVIRNRQTQTFNGTTYAIGKRFQYDHAGRLVLTKLKLDNDTKDSVTINQVAYNELGQLQTKKLHSINGSTPQQTEDFTYNIRGWLSQINDPENLGTDLYGMHLNYNDPCDMGSESIPHFNGNISQIIWNTQGKGKQGYAFDYDPLNRLYAAYYSTKTNSVWTASDARFEGRIDGYDLNGNAYDLRRIVQDFSNRTEYYFTYTGNQLTQVTDYNYVDYYYQYDKNGNTQVDGLRGNWINYNILNLPTGIISDNGAIHYIYTAGGEKVAKQNTQGLWQYYAGNMIYNNDKTLDYVLFDEGMIRRTVNNGQENFTYIYNLKDHLGNTRVAFEPGTSGPVTVQVADYYPFGKAFEPMSPNNGNKYLYNGKELQDDVLMGGELGLYDYGARFYDPQIGRWNSIDPLAELSRRWSPYNYCYNNPLNLIDPDGMSPEDGRKAFPGGFEMEKWIDIQVALNGSDDFIKTIPQYNIPEKERSDYDYIKSGGGDPKGTKRDRRREARKRNSRRITNFSLFDERGKELFNKWLNGKTKTFSTYNGNWGEYMKKNASLMTEINYALTLYSKDINGSGPVDFSFHAQLDDNGYFTGYQMLHGTDKTVGDFQIKGRVYDLGDKLVFNVVLTWNDKIDPNYSYREDEILDKSIRKVYSPQDYNIHISWNDFITIKK